MQLSLFFTEGVSLQTWQEVGMLDRELALYQALAAGGVQVRLVTYGGPIDIELGRQLRRFDIRANRFKLPIALYQQSLVWTLPRGAGQVFKSNQVAGADFALRIARRKGAHFIARCGYLPSDFARRRNGEGSVEHQQARRVESEVFRGADRVVVTTDAMREAVINDYGVTPQCVSVIPNYVQTDVFRPFEKEIDSRIRIGFVGRLDTQKNLHVLFDGILPLDIELELVGEGPQRTELAAKAQGGNAGTKFLGNLPNRELPEMMNNWDVFVLPSLYEGHPKALLEAMACGLPVIGSDVSGIRELIQHGENGLLCSPTAAGIREALEALMADAALRARLGKNARKFAVDNFSLQKIVELEWTVLRELAG